jgi:hypothetical protein
MAYTRKTRDEYQLWSHYGHGGAWSHELSEDSWQAIRAQLKCYRENCPEGRYLIKVKRVPIVAPPMAAGCACNGWCGCHEEGVHVDDPCDCAQVTATA